MEASKRQVLEKKYHLEQKRHEKEMNHSKAMTRLSREEERAREYSVKEIATKYERMDSIAKQKAEELSQVIYNSYNDIKSFFSSPLVSYDCTAYCSASRLN